MQENLYIQLLYKQLAGEIQPEEQSQLEDWLSRSDGNKDIADSVTQAWNLGANYTQTVEVDLDDAFNDLENRIAEDEKKEKGTVKSLNDNRSRMQSLTILWRIAAGFLFLAIAGFVLKNQFFSSPEWQTISVVAGEKESVSLADGTVVWVNGGSTFEYPTVFNGNDRNVKLKGEAYFEVTKNAKQPFKIESSSGTVTVLGTSFNVLDMPSSPTMEVQVIEGKVQVQVKETQEKVILVKNDKSIYTKKDKHLQKTKANANNAIVWKTGELRFFDEKLSSALDLIKENFGVQIQIENAEMMNCSFSSSVKKTQTGKEIAETIADVFEMKIETTDLKHLILKGGSCE